MLNQKKYKKIFYILIVFLFTIINTIGIIFINLKYPSYSCEKFELNQKFIFDSFEYEFKDFEIFSNDKFKQKYDSVVIPDEEHINIIVSTRIANVSDEPKDILLEQFILETNLWSSNIGLYTFTSLNPNIKSTSITINPGENISLILPFNYIRLYDEEFSYELVSKKNFNLCFYMNYPQKAIVKLK